MRDVDLGFFNGISKKKIVEKTAAAHPGPKKKVQMAANNRNFEYAMIVKKINESVKGDTQTEFLSQNSIASELKPEAPRISMPEKIISAFPERRALSLAKKRTDFVPQEVVNDDYSPQDQINHNN